MPFTYVATIWDQLQSYLARTVGVSVSMPVLVDLWGLKLFPFVSCCVCFILSLCETCDCISQRLDDVTTSHSQSHEVADTLISWFTVSVSLFNTKLLSHSTFGFFILSFLQLLMLACTIENGNFLYGKNVLPTNPTSNFSDMFQEPDIFILTISTIQVILM